MTRKQSNQISALDLKIARIKVGLRQYFVAQKVGIAPNRLSEIENGRREVSADLLQRIFQVIKGSNYGKTEKKN